MEYVYKYFHLTWDVIPPVLAIYAISFGGNVAGLLHEKLKIFSLVLLVLIIPFISRFTTRPPAVIPLTLLVIVMCMSMLVSPSPLGAWLVLLWAGVVITYWLSEVIPTAQLEQAMIAVIAAMALVVFYEMIEWWFQMGFQAGVLVRPPTMLFNPNIIAPVLMIGIALALYTRRIAWLFVFMIAVVFTGSRATFLGMAMGTIVLAVLQAPRLRLTGVYIVISATLVIFLLLLILHFRNPVYTLLERIDLWRVAAITFLRQPLIGIGPERYRVAVPELAQMQSSLIFTHAHNVYLHVAAELGVLGLLALGGIITTTVVRIRHIFQSGHKQGATIAAALLVGFLVQGLLDYVYWVLALVLMILWTGRILNTPLPQTHSSASLAKLPWRLAITAALALSGYPALMFARQIDRQTQWTYVCATGVVFLLACAFYTTIPTVIQSDEPATLKPSRMSHQMNVEHVPSPLS